MTLDEMRSKLVTELEESRDVGLTLAEEEKIASYLNLAYNKGYWEGVGGTMDEEVE